MAEASQPLGISTAIPVIRIFDEKKAQEFYQDFLGFSVEWTHRFEEDLPIYMQIKRDGLILHLSEHHGDASPGSTCFVPITNAMALHKELGDKNYRNMKPGLDAMPWGLQITVIDPFGNRLRFCQLRNTRGIAETTAV